MPATFRPSNTAAPGNPQQNAPPSVGQKPGLWRLVFRIVHWSTYAAALITLLMVFHAQPTPVIATSPQAAARVEEKIAIAEQSIASGNPTNVRLDETEVNSYLASHLEMSPRSASAAPGHAASAPPAAAPNATAGGPSATSATSDPTASVPTPSGTDAEQVAQARSTVRDVKIQLIDDRVRAFVVFDFHGKDMTLQLEGKLSSSGGYLRFEPVSGEIGSLPIPESALRSAIGKMMDAPENREKLKLPPELSDLRIENGDLVATYR